jgi:hypothetical protein
MTLTTLTAKVGRLETARGREAPTPASQRRQARLEALRLDPLHLFRLAGIIPDPWQRDVYGSTTTGRFLNLCSRQCGKSTVAAAVALKTALLSPGSLALLLSPSLRQSAELFRKVIDLYRRTGRPVLPARELALTLELVNGSRIVSLPESEQTIRGYSGVALLVIDEAARVSDDLYRAVRPMLAVSGGRLLALCTPFGKRGWFFSEWVSGREWQRVMIRADECPRISKAFLAEERASLGERCFRQEYECSWEDATGAVFRGVDIAAAFAPADVLPLFP